MTAAKQIQMIQRVIEACKIQIQRLKINRPFNYETMIANTEKQIAQHRIEIERLKKDPTA